LRRQENAHRKGNNKNERTECLLGGGREGRPSVAVDTGLEKSDRSICFSGKEAGRRENIEKRGITTHHVVVVRKNRAVSKVFWGKHNWKRQGREQLNSKFALQRHGMFREGRSI